MNDIEKYLEKSKKILQKQNFFVTNKTTNRKVAVIVESQNHFLLQSVVYNVMNSLGEEWNLHIFSHDPKNLQFPK